MRITLASIISACRNVLNFIINKFVLFYKKCKTISMTMTTYRVILPKAKLYKLKDFHPEICNLSAESLNGNNFKMLEDAITRIIGVGIDALIVA